MAHSKTDGKTRSNWHDIYVLFGFLAALALIIFGTYWAMNRIVSLYPHTMAVVGGFLLGVVIAIALGAIAYLVTNYIDLRTKRP
jgi:hypothetical protein